MIATKDTTCLSDPWQHWVLVATSKFQSKELTPLLGVRHLLEHCGLYTAQVGWLTQTTASMVTRVTALSPVSLQV